MKICNKCNLEKFLKIFSKDKYKKDGYNTICKSCVSKYNVIWRELNKTKIKEHKKQNYRKNRLHYIEYTKKHYLAHKNEKLAYTKEYKKLHRDKYNAYTKKERATPQGKLSHRISNAVRSVLKGNKNKKHWENIVGYTAQELKEHIEKQFQPGMSWDNYGLYGWHIDHIKPKSSFNYSSYEEQQFKDCWKLDNLQPLWAVDNLRKSNKVIYGNR